MTSGLVSQVRGRASAVVRHALLHGPEPVLAVVGEPLLRRYSPRWLVAPGHLERLFPALDARQLAGLRRRIHARALRKLMAYSLVRHREWRALEGLLEVSGLEHRPSGGAILLSWHLGLGALIKHALGARGWRPSVLSAVQGAATYPDTIYVGQDSDVRARASAGLVVLKALRAGRAVLVAGDGPMGAGHEVVSALGQTPRMRVGAATLAHMARVPIVPVSSSWADARVRVRVHPALALPYDAAREAFVPVACQAIASWLERWLEREPEVLSAYHIDWLLGAETFGGIAPEP